ncbi:MAG: zinc ribbon domain-containing protein [Nostocaceae cyanobacterium]|nr:zinc ribbon domain-containing protein [Nostocaceae cyanobacterium]
MGMIRSALKAKLDDVGGVFIEVPTRKIKPSQTCPKCGHQEKKSLEQRIHICNCGYSQQRDIASAEVILVWYSNNLPGLGTSLAGVDDSSSTSRTRKQAGSMFAKRSRRVATSSCEASKISGYARGCRNPWLKLS